MENMELQHHGILGMRWGVRRYQNKDGTLTTAGKKRYNAEMQKLKDEETVLKNKKRTQAKIDKLLKKRQELDDMKNPTSTNQKNPTSKPGAPKSIKDMTDEELMAKINRLRLEQTLASLTPKTQSKGEEFMDKVLKPIGQKVTNKLGDTILDKVNKTMRDKFGLDVDEKELKKLQKEFNTVDLKKKIAEANAAIKKANGEESEYDRLKREADIAGFKTRIRNNKKAEAEGNNSTSTTEDLDKFAKAFTIKPREVSKEIRDQGENYINDVIFDDLSHM